MPDIFEMAGQAPRRDQDDVDPHILARSGETGGECVGGAGDPDQPMPVDRKRQSLIVIPALHLDKGDGAPAPGDKIDFAHGRPHAPCHDPPAL